MSMKLERVVGVGVLIGGCVVLPALANAQQASEEEEVSPPDRPGTFSLGIGLVEDARASGADRNQAFGHSGAAFQFSPEVHTGWVSGRLLDLKLRLDMQDGLYELGVPALLTLQLQRQGAVDVTLDAGVGFDHLGVTMLMSGESGPGWSVQSTAHMHMALSRGAFTLGASGGNKLYRARIKDRLELDRRWTFARPYLLWRPHERIGVELSTQLQWWSHADPGDTMRAGDRSLTHQVAIDVKASEEVSLQLFGGARQDRPQAGYKPFGGLQITWAPSFGEQRPAPTPSKEE